MTATATLPAAPTSAKDLHQGAEKPKAGQMPESFNAAHHVGEPKMDGWRMLVWIDEDGKAHLYSRTAKAYTVCLPEIVAELEATLKPGTWLDCEAHGILTGENGEIHHDWKLAQKALGGGTLKPPEIRGPMMLMAFDLIAHAGIDARSLPYAKRRALLESIAAKAGNAWSRILVIPQVAPTTEALDALLAAGYEGMVIKDTRARYASGKKGSGWTKFKAETEADVIFMGTKPGKNGYTGMIGSVRFGAFGADGLIEVGSCSGMDMNTRIWITEHADEMAGQPIEINYLERQPNPDKPAGFTLRSPQWKRPRPDKPAEACTLEAI